MSNSTTVTGSDLAAGAVVPDQGLGSLLGQHRGPLTVDDDFLVLDDPIEQEDFCHPVQVDGRELQEAVLMVQGMYCPACSETVEAALGGRRGVESVRVHAATRRVTLRWDPAQTLLSALARNVGQSGYRLLPMRQALSVEERLAETRLLMWRLFVAGFCTMQVMMYSWPFYVTEPGEIPAIYDQLLRMANWMLSVPVVLFSSMPFFQSAWRDLRHGRIGMDMPVSIGILVTFIASTGATFDPTGVWGHEIWFDSLTMFVFFLLGGRYLQSRMRDRTAGSLDALMNRLPEQCERQLADGGFETISLKRLRVGDVLRVQAGQAFPGDATVLGESATVDEALLTGESQPVTRLRGQTVVAGSYNLAGAALVRIDKIGRDTRFGQIVSLMEQASTEKPDLIKLADRIAGPFLIVVLLSAGFGAWYWWQIDPALAVPIAVAVLVVTCPCALALSTPSAMLASAGALAQRGILVRRLLAFEALCKIDTVVFDKTGTLTQDRVVLREVIARPGLEREQALRMAWPLASASLHPVSRAIAVQAQPLASAPNPAGQGAAPGAEPVDLVQERPGAGLVLERADGGEWRLGSAALCGLDEAQLLAQGRSTADSPCAYLCDEHGWVATFVMDEGVRADAPAAVAELRAMGFSVHLLSGDRIGAVQRVAQQLGIEQVVAGASPERKLEVVAALQQQGAQIAMVGDGMNDGPVLARAQVSFALGHGAPLTQSQSDFVVQSGRLSELVQTVRQARRTLRILKQNLCWAGGYNASMVPLAIAGYVPPWLAGLGMALSSFVVIGNAMRLSRLPDMPVPDPAAAAAALSVR
ncbi:heavy metal translocating P-type ATPase [Serpentinimonas maccroryi]|uniref:heavy metal translocating P-type ATPase n=1 Tax=Serpentinimonas maccroryi TaxID=1458426 RepID=UPI0020336E27|nr:cation-translocating P-type ATPase [Serpentinimonas maccroryi]MCM2479620.1 cation-translocating P-type ATPase [Serpentinimonas maccroryi]